VNGDVQLLGGSLEVSGRVDGSILAAGGVLKLRETAQVDGDITLAGAVIERSSQAVVEGEIINETEIPFNVYPFNSTRFDGLWSPMRWWLENVWNLSRLWAWRLPWQPWLCCY
jgi:hypothetical protein